MQRDGEPASPEEEQELARILLAMAELVDPASVRLPVTGLRGFGTDSS